MSGLDIRNDWQLLTKAAVEALPATLGVYEIGDSEGCILYIGYAGGRTLFGLRSPLADFLAEPPVANAQFRVELNMQYISRWKELLMDHQAHHGSLPPLNPADDAFALGHLGPSSGEVQK